MIKLMGTGVSAAYLTGNRFNIILGASVLSTDTQELPSISGLSFPIETDRANNNRSWIDGNLSPVPALQVTIGGDFNGLQRTVNRSEVLSHTQFGPKSGRQLGYSAEHNPASCLVLQSETAPYWRSARPLWPDD
jgi:hypothetical protein